MIQIIYRWPRFAKHITTLTISKVSNRLFIYALGLILNLCLLTKRDKRRTVCDNAEPLKLSYSW